MRYFKINTRGNHMNAELGMIYESNLNKISHSLVLGEAVRDRFPLDAVLELAGDRGTQLSSLLGNSLSFLIVNSTMKKRLKTPNHNHLK